MRTLRCAHVPEFVGGKSTFASIAAAACGLAVLTCQNDGVQPVPLPPPPPPDVEAPSFGSFNPVPPDSVTTNSAQGLFFDIGGSISDANTITRATLSVLVDGTDANGSGADGNCDIATDYLLTLREITQNAFNLINGTNMIDYLESPGVGNPGGPVVVRYCFWVNAQDRADNSQSVFAASVVTWLSGAEPPPPSSP